MFTTPFYRPAGIYGLPNADDPHEIGFRQWYRPRALELGLDLDPDNPEHHYDYRAAFEAGAEPGPDGHWPSEFKAPDHPNRFVDGIDTITGRPVSGPLPSAPPSGLLERLADRMSGMGYGGGEEERRAALRRALMVGGMALLGGAEKKGLGALPEAVAAGMGGYGEGLQEQAALRRQREKDDLERDVIDRQERYAQAQIDQMEEGRKAKQEEFQEAIRARAELVKQRRDALERLPPEQRSRLEPLIGSEEFDEAYLKVTEPPDPEKRVPGFELSPGQDRYEMVDGKWTKVASKAPLPREGGSEKPPWASGQFEYVTRGDQMVKIDKATGSVTPVYSFTGTGADRENARIAVARDLTRSQIENWSDTTTPPDPRKIFADNYRWTQEIVQDKQGGPAPQPNNRRPPEQKLKDIEATIGRPLPAEMRQEMMRELKGGRAPRELVEEFYRDNPHLRPKTGPYARKK